MARRRTDESPSYRAVHRNVRMSPRKVKWVVDLIRGQDVNRARTALQLTKKRAAYLVDRVLKSAIANADQTGQVDVDRLYVAGATADGARSIKRWMTGAMGRVKPILKRNCHIQVVLKQRDEE